MPLLTVQRGDLITADIWNLLVQKVNELESKQNQGTGAPVITGLVPLGSVQVGSKLEVDGRNFARPADSNIVSVGGYVIDRFDLTSSDTALIFGLPIITFSGSQLNTQVTVRTQAGAASYPLVLIPAQQVPKGFVVFNPDPANAGLGTISSGQTYTWRFQLVSATDIAESYQLSLVVSNATGTIVPLGTWQSNVSLVDASNQPLSATPIHCEPYVPFAFGVRVAVPANADLTSGVTFAVHAKSLNNDTGLSRNSDPIAIQVGHITPVSDPRVQWANEVPATPTATNLARRVTDATTGKEYVEIPYNGFGLLQVRATFAAGTDSGGNYAYSKALDNPAAGVWNVANPSPGTSIGKNPGENELIGVILSLTTGQTAGHTEERVLTLTATRTSTPSFVSFMTVNIRGYVH